MKKVVIIAGIILTTGLTALSISKKDNKAGDIKVRMEKTDFGSKNAANTVLATAD
jgi:hypothetical protein